jgi:hypothetical protein
MYTESPPLAGRASSNRPHRLGPRTSYRSSGFGNGPRKRPPTIRRISRALARFSAVALISVGATIAWQSYVAGVVRAWAPSLGWLLPASPPGPAATSAELQAQLKPLALDLANVRRSVEQLATNQDQLARKEDQLAQGQDQLARKDDQVAQGQDQLARKEDQMAQTIATLQAAEQDIRQKILALAPTAPKVVHVPPPKTLQPAAQ